MTEVDVSVFAIDISVLRHRRFTFFSRKTREAIFTPVHTLTPFVAASGQTALLSKDKAVKSVQD